MTTFVGRLSMTVSLKKILFTFIVAAGGTSLIATGQQPVMEPAVTQEINAAAPAVTNAGMPGAYFDNAANSSDSVVSCDPGCCQARKIFGRGIIKQSDHQFDCFISPMTNPIFFEDPRALTEARPIFVHHKVPLAAGSGSVNLYAVQLRARLSENVSLIATKDGYFTSTNPIVDDGWADLAAGLKFNLVRNVEKQRLLSAGFTFEMPTGEASALQNNGDGELNLFTSWGMQLGCRAHWISATGLRQPMNTTDESTSMYWSNHFDYRVRRGLYLLTEGNWYNWTKSGVDGPIPGIEGLDVINLGSPNVTGNDIVTGAVGVKLKPNGHNEVGFAFEFPLTERRDILDNRITADWIIRY
jgi:hypothetical protein